MRTHSSICVLTAWLMVASGLIFQGHAQLVEKRPAAKVVCEVVEGLEERQPLNPDFKYSLAFLTAHQPGTADASFFHWSKVPEGTTATVDHLVRLEGRDFYVLKFTRQNKTRRDGVECTSVLLLRGVSPGYYQPVFMAILDEAYFNGELISNRKHPMAYVFEVGYEGTGAMTSVHLLDLRGNPRRIYSAHSGRLSEADFRSRDEYLKALATMRAQMKQARGE